MVDRELNKLLEKLAKNPRVTDVASWTKPSNQEVSSSPNTQCYSQFHLGSNKIIPTIIAATTITTITSTTIDTTITTTTTTQTCCWNTWKEYTLRELSIDGRWVERGKFISTFS
jgi:hypothetical protein